MGIAQSRAPAGDVDHRCRACSILRSIYKALKCLFSKLFRFISFHPRLQEPLLPTRDPPALATPKAQRQTVVKGSDSHAYNAPLFLPRLQKPHLPIQDSPALTTTRAQRQTELKGSDSHACNALLFPPRLQKPRLPIQDPPACIITASAQSQTVVKGSDSHACNALLFPPRLQKPRLPIQDPPARIITASAQRQTVVKGSDSHACNALVFPPRLQKPRLPIQDPPACIITASAQRQTVVKGSDSHAYNAPLDRYLDIVRTENKIDANQKEVVVKKPVVADNSRWIKHYSSSHRILVVGDGDFSFSACLATAFCHASNMIATSLNNKEFLEKNYRKVISNLQTLKARKCKVLHDVDVTKMAQHKTIGHIAFDRIIFNFPYAGFFKDLSRNEVLRRHQRLVSLFLKNAKDMLSKNGEVHISHKTNGFHNEWRVESIASSHGLRLIEAVEFQLSDYPGYHTKYGFGGDYDFDCNPSKTYKFRFEVHVQEQVVKTRANSPRCLHY